MNESTKRKLTVDEMVAMRNAGSTYRQIAEASGVTVGTAFQTCRRAGVPRINKHTAQTDNTDNTQQMMDAGIQQVMEAVNVCVATTSDPVGLVCLILALDAARKQAKDKLGSLL